MVECAYAGTDTVNVASDLMWGTISQPSLDAVTSQLKDSKYDTVANPEKITSRAT
jgi:pyruvate carboxylase